MDKDVAKRAEEFAYEIMELFEDVRFDPYNTFYVVLRRFSRCPDPPSCLPDRRIRKREKEREKEPFPSILYALITNYTTN